MYELTAEQWAALSLMRDRAATLADPVGSLEVMLRSPAGALAGVTSVSDLGLVADGETELGKVRATYLRAPSAAYTQLTTDIGPVVEAIEEKGVLL